MDDMIHTLIEEVNSWETPAYQEETKRESNTLQMKEEMEVIHRRSLRRWKL